MANEEQLAILKQGVEVWNRWRGHDRAIIHKIKVDLREADLIRANLAAANFEVDLSGANLSGINLNGAILWRADLTEANLVDADLSFAHLDGARLTRALLVRGNLNQADLSGANLCEARLMNANLTRSDLSRANLANANLLGAILKNAILEEADLSEARLHEADMRGTDVLNCNFRGARLGATIFGNSNLNQAIGLETGKHAGPSNVSTDTFVHSKGRIPEAFLRGCGLSDWEIESVKLYNPDLSNDEFIDIQNRIFDLRNRQAIQISPLFISYNHGNTDFVNMLGNRLTEMGIRYWRDIKDLKAGRVEKQLDRAIRQNPTVLLILSEHSLQSDWVEHEVREARKLEKELDRDVLCPIALDDSWKNSRWPQRIMEQIMEYNILDFSAWQDNSKFAGMFRKLMDGLELFYEK